MLEWMGLISLFFVTEVTHCYYFCTRRKTLVHIDSGKWVQMRDQRQTASHSDSRPNRSAIRTMLELNFHDYDGLQPNMTQATPNINTGSVHVNKRCTKLFQSTFMDYKYSKLQNQLPVSYCLQRVQHLKKGQLFSKCPFGVFRSPKKPTKFFPGFLPQTL